MKLDFIYLLCYVMLCYVKFKFYLNLILNVKRNHINSKHQINNRNELKPQTFLLGF